MKTKGTLLGRRGIGLSNSWWYWGLTIIVVLAGIVYLTNREETPKNVVCGDECLSPFIPIVDQILAGIPEKNALILTPYTYSVLLESYSNVSDLDFFFTQPAQEYAQLFANYRGEFEDEKKFRDGFESLFFDDEKRTKETIRKYNITYVLVGRDNQTEIVSCISLRYLYGAGFEKYCKPLSKNKDYSDIYVEWFKPSSDLVYFRLLDGSPIPGFQLISDYACSEVSRIRCRFKLYRLADAKDDWDEARIVTFFENVTIAQMASDTERFPAVCSNYVMRMNLHLVGSTASDALNNTQQDVRANIINFCGVNRQFYLEKGGWGFLTEPLQNVVGNITVLPELCRAQIRESFPLPKDDDTLLDYLHSASGEGRAKLIEFCLIKRQSYLKEEPKLQTSASHSEHASGNSGNQTSGQDIINGMSPEQIEINARLGLSPAIIAWP